MVLNGRARRALDQVIDRGDHGEARAPYMRGGRDPERDAVAIHDVLERWQPAVRDLDAGLAGVRRVVDGFRRRPVERPGERDMDGLEDAPFPGEPMRGEDDIARAAALALQRRRQLMQVAELVPGCVGPEV